MLFLGDSQARRDLALGLVEREAERRKAHVGVLDVAARLGLEHALDNQLIRQAELVSESSFAVRELLRSLRQSQQSKSAPAPKRVDNSA